MTTWTERFPAREFQRDLLDWFARERRDLPWRKDRDPYKVWVSEVMLQQTRVETVIPYFEKFIEQFPTLEALAGADEDEVLKAWEGLGYYSRVRNLHAAVKEVKEHYGGKVPDRPDEFAKLKGVGPYTVGAVLSLAYGVPEPAVDGNVMRVLSRLFLVTDDIAKASTRKRFEQIVREIMAYEHPGAFNEALIELGALVCTPRRPSCLLCPVQAHCRAFAEGVPEELPVKTKKTAVKQVPLAVAVLADEEGRILIRKRGHTGLLANLWEFPGCEINGEGEKEKLEKGFLNEHGLKVKLGEPLASFDHVFSHLIWKLTVFSGQLLDGERLDEPYRLVSARELDAYAFPVSHQRIWREYQERAGEARRLR
ncbi:A/G-specific adenine glycosylase [Geobacillus subterraneus]|uniref:Adenine DNA glycosylase n=2 Tax=Geobacillus TaxID=129337 RepID=A0ABN4NKX2_9BACL|nr:MULTISPECIES: A/G-specific adenine glycosylase [Geobacillus]AMX85335.1 A/G-specific adenine glycosylase [Geobacillus subterraneus]KZS24966.1 A/G-specific adenine glycosylase [Geobacillus subterraneus]OXB87609.1 A/G-specific adenine glycosylase [Geobacillus uzenensis]QIZ66635.1 A/G-specific adenine glycosylase [Geobacillus subterraneus]WPZ18851.1 A/G-specific adenine glycosylase [Geobacillus subterraneus]